MRNAMIAILVLAFSGGMMHASAGQSQFTRTNEPASPSQKQELPASISNAAASLSAIQINSRFPLGGGAKSNGKTDSAAWAARMFTAGRSMDFGPVPFGTQLLHRFEITNIYEIPVEIAEPRVGCGCVTAIAGKRILQPGERTTIDVTMDTRAFTGANMETVRVKVGPNPNSSCVLKVSAVSQTDVVFKPDRIINFGSVVRGQVSAQSIEVEYSGALAWEIKKVLVVHDLPIEATLSEPVRRPGSTAYRLTVTLRNDAHEGRIRDYLYLKTNQIDAPLVPVLVTAKVRASPKVPPGE